MTTASRAPLAERLDALALAFAERSWDGNDNATDSRALCEFLRDHAYSLSEFAQQAREEYVRTVGDEDAEIPTPAQGVALARFLRPAFRGEARDRSGAHVSRGGAGLPENYLHVRLTDGYEGGIAPNGDTST